MAPCRFNPCSGGIPLLITLDKELIHNFYMFQSLFWWNTSIDNILHLRTRRRNGFQSLFWWNTSIENARKLAPRKPMRSFNPCSGGIPLLMNLHLKATYPFKRFNPCSGGIPLLMYEAGLDFASTPVSILVLVEYLY